MNSLTKRRTYVIAEAGVNHNGSLDLACRLVDAAAAAGADAVKFQTFKASRLVTASAKKAAYQKQGSKDETQFSMLKALELDGQAHRRLIHHCEEKRIHFLSTPFDEESLDLLASTFQLPVLKFSSGDVTNAPLLLKAAAYGKRVLLSTGMATLGEIEQALSALAFGYLHPGEAPSLAGFAHAYGSDEGQAVLRSHVTILHCTTEYPSPFDEVNLRVMETLRNAFQLPVGLSDHTEGIAVPVAAAALGADVIEKHFTLDRGLPGPDHRASVEPAELEQMITSIRQVEQALGTPVKHPTLSEWKNMIPVRKSIVAKLPIREGELFSTENLALKRPGDGVAPAHLWEFLGKSATRNYEKDEKVNF